MLQAQKKLLEEFFGIVIQTLEQHIPEQQHITETYNFSVQIVTMLGNVLQNSS